MVLPEQGVDIGQELVAAADGAADHMRVRLAEEPRLASLGVCAQRVRVTEEESG